MKLRPDWAVRVIDFEPQGRFQVIVEIGDRASAGPPGPAAEPLGPREQEEEEGSGGAARPQPKLSHRGGVKSQVSRFSKFKRT